MEHDKKRYYFYDLLQYVPIKIHAEIKFNESTLYIADPNIILSFLFNDLIYSPSFVHDNIKRSISYVLSANKESKFSPCEVESYVGSYCDYYTYLKDKYQKEKIFLKRYNPIAYKQEFGEYRQIAKM